MKIYIKGVTGAASSILPVIGVGKRGGMPRFAWTKPTLPAWYIAIAESFSNMTSPILSIWYQGE
ncbi:hypothetical protein [Flavobacterium sp. FlaQc-48]|uniref:hypothetical protein n=1 Tax=Flavobacterium sp. FlaQc-48 TaxID=3374181 RepID=UPI003756A0BC